MNRIKYEVPVISISLFDEYDIVTTSGNGGKHLNSYGNAKKAGTISLSDLIGD